MSDEASKLGAWEYFKKHVENGDIKPLTISQTITALMRFSKTHKGAKVILFLVEEGKVKSNE